MLPTNETIDPDLHPLIKVLKRFEDKQNEFADFGACDTEPNTNWQVLLRNATLGQNAVLPATADEWELYTMAGVYRVVMQLNTAARAALKYIDAARDGKPETWAKVYDFLGSYCYRVHWG
ncbi:MAG: hypothetical protein JRC86_00515 [Deltaproteobacteria bacterium]|nr:hypothetical protein [Deltaproteobacteria bacterium]